LSSSYCTVITIAMQYVPRCVRIAQDWTPLFDYDRLRHASPPDPTKAVPHLRQLTG
jgi:hypothetical protein